MLGANALSLTDFENDDGSYSVGTNIHTRGDTSDAVYALLSKSNGWTDASANYIEEDQQRQRQNFQFSGTAIKVPFSEIIRLIEAFVQVKGEIASRLNHLLSDNSELIRAVWNTLVTKIGTLHSFTLNGLVVLRKIMEFAAQLFGQWSINVDVNQHF